MNAQWQYKRLLGGYNEAHRLEIKTLQVDFITATYADDAAILAAHRDHIEASQRLQESLFYIQI